MSSEMFDIGEEVECSFYGYGYVYYEQALFYICLNDNGTQKDICHEFLRKKTCVK